MADPKIDAARLLSEALLAEARQQSEQILEGARRQAGSLLAKAGAEADDLLRDKIQQAHAEASRRAESILSTVPLETERMRANAVEQCLNDIYQETLRRLLVHEGFDYRTVLVAIAADALRQMTGEFFLVQLSPEDCAQSEVRSLNPNGEGSLPYDKAHQRSDESSLLAERAGKSGIRDSPRFLESRHLGTVNPEQEEPRLAGTLPSECVDSSAASSASSGGVTAPSRIECSVPQIAAGLEEEIIRHSKRSGIRLLVQANPELTGGGVVVENGEKTQVWDNRFTTRLDRLWPELRRQIAFQTGLAGMNPPGLV